ncbi:hypothetical protein B0H13DRAFT_2581299 [Mycena leptocephala]|nr:hypothetical protein B0H13DRAFT_2581299 [Mycena leptocephala]
MSWMGHTSGASSVETQQIAGKNRTRLSSASEFTLGGIYHCVRDIRTTGRHRIISDSSCLCDSIVTPSKASSTSTHFRRYRTTRVPAAQPLLLYHPHAAHPTLVSVNLPPQHRLVDFPAFAALQIRAGTMPEPLYRRLLHHARRSPLCTPPRCDPRSMRVHMDVPRSSSARRRWGMWSGASNAGVRERYCGRAIREIYAPGRGGL